MTALTWSSAPICFVRAIVCPYCGSDRHTIVRSNRETDRSITRRCVCRTCSRRFLVVIEVQPPDRGSVVFPAE